MSYLPQRDVQNLIDKIKPAAALLRESVVMARPAEDPIPTFIQRLTDERIDIEDLRKSVVELLPVFQWQWFFTQIGLTQELSFFSETFRRFEERFLPPLQRPTEVLWLVDEMFDGEPIKWLTRLKPIHFEKLLLFFTDENVQLPEEFLSDLHASLEILAQRLSGLGLDVLIAKRLRSREDLHREFLELGRLSFTERDKSKTIENLLFLNGLKGCEKAVTYIREQSVIEGTSLVLTYRLVQIEELIERLKQILSLLQSSAGANSLRKLGDCLKQIMLAHYENTKVGDFLGRTVEILAYQLTVLAERTGEHYISNNAKELKAMWWSAIKAAMIVAVLVVIKITVSRVQLPPLFQALTYGSIYATGFVIIQIIGGALATKQPAMTASTLAASMDGAENSEEMMEHLLEAIIRTLRTQVAALLGNFIFAFPFAVIIVFPFLVLHMPIIDFEKSNHLIQDHLPFHSLSFFYAALAGVCLFLSGLVSGLADNWFDFNQIGDRLDRIFSGNRAKKFILALRENFGIWMGNITLGYMLGSMSAIGTVTGLPLDIRHVTFASGTFGMAWIHQQDRLPWPTFFMIALGVLTMGVINLTVSFSLSLFVAMKSRRVKLKQGRRLLWLMAKRLITKPQDLFIDNVKH